jgi:AcrR family transcriptional regulator
MIKPSTSAASARATETIPSPQEPRRLKTRAALLRAGADLLARRPIDAIPVNDIVSAAGVAKGSFFNHFEDKDAFAAAIAAEIRLEVEDRVTAANARVSDAAVRMARANCVFVQFALAEPTRARIMVRGHEWATAADHPLNRGLHADIADGVASGRFGERAVLSGALYIIGLCLMMMASVVHDRLSPEPARRLASEMLLLALTGLGVDEAESRTIIAGATEEIIVGAV